MSLWLGTYGSIAYIVFMFHKKQPKMYNMQIFNLDIDGQLEKWHLWHDKKQKILCSVIPHEDRYITYFRHIEAKKNMKSSTNLLPGWRRWNIGSSVASPKSLMTLIDLPDECLNFLEKHFRHIWPIKLMPLNNGGRISFLLFLLNLWETDGAQCSGAEVPK